MSDRFARFLTGLAILADYTKHNADLPWRVMSVREA